MLAADEALVIIDGVPSTFCIKLGLHPASVQSLIDRAKALWIETAPNAPATSGASV